MGFDRLPTWTVSSAAHPPPGEQKRDWMCAYQWRRRLPAYIVGNAGVGNPRNEAATGFKEERMRHWALRSFALALCVFTAGPAFAQDVETSLQEAREDVQTAAAQQLHLISPRNFEEATRKLSEAQDLYESGERIENIRRRVAECRAALERARTFEDVGRVLLAEALQARGDALAANAPDFAPEEWGDARREMHDAGRAVERGDQNEARAKAAQAAREFQLAEIQAIRRDVIGRARELQAEAKRRDANEKARLTYDKADSLLWQAERTIQQGGREGRAEAGEYAQAAAEAYQHAARIASLADVVSRDEKREVEALMLSYEKELQKIAQALRFTSTFTAGPEPVADQAVAVVQSLYEDRQNLQENLAAASQQALGVEQAAEAERRRQLAAELRARELREKKIEDVNAYFLPEEAEVLVRGNDLLIRLYGIDFPVGEALINPESFLLLTKVQSVMREFPGAPVTVAGHSDAQGNDEFNQKLSEDRAMAVRTYLIANMNVRPGQITAIGYGESQPVASNETAEGRAKNRRIDVSLTLP
jgi:outer membrane protein OmpA-like peptidoglycan-associated protein